MRYIPNIFKITFYIVIITLIFYLNAFTQTNSENIPTKPFSKERQLLSVNLLPSNLAIYPYLMKSFFRNIDTFAGLANIDLKGIKLYNDITAKDILDSINFKGSFWYIPNISYTFLFNRFIGIELGIGVQSVSYSLTVPQNKVVDLIKIAKPEYAEVIGSDTYFKMSFVYIPIHLGLKIMSGNTHKTVNTFKFGIETVVYNVETLNGVTGIGTIRKTISPTFYISYELGWQINLFPNKDWRVKPYIDFSLFEIGYYLKSSMEGVYNNAKEGIGFLGSGLIDINSYLPEWNNLGSIDEYGKYLKYAKYVTSLKIAIFPRFGFTIRF